MDQLEDQDGITAYHGSPHDFEQFDISKIGTGEGAQAYGHGLYFAEAEPTAKHFAENAGDKYSPESIANRMLKGWGNRDKAIQQQREHIGRLEKSHNEDFIAPYRKALEILESGQKPKIGHMYEVSINAHPDHFLDWDMPLNEQPYVMDKLLKSGALNPDGSLSFMYNETPRKGGEMYQRLTSPMAEKITGGKSQKHASDFLHKIGIKGIKYFDAGAGENGGDTHNYVVFDDKLVGVKRKYARGGVVNG